MKKKSPYVDSEVNRPTHSPTHIQTLMQEGRNKHTQHKIIILIIIILMLLLETGESPHWVPYSIGEIGFSHCILTLINKKI